MPGFYVSNQSSGIGSGLANAISQIAQNYSPKTAAEAANLAQDTEHLQWQNRKDSTGVPAFEQGVLGAGQLAGATGGEIRGGSLAGDIGRIAQAGMSQGGNPYIPPTSTDHPETERGAVDTSRFGIMGRIAAGRYAQGAGVDELLKLNNYGIDITKGPGQDPTSKTDVYNTSSVASNAPFPVRAGETHVDPFRVAGNLPSGPTAQPAATPAPAPAATPAPASAATPAAGPPQPGVSPAAQPGAPTLGGGGSTSVTTPATPATPAPAPAPAPTTTADTSTDGAYQSAPGVWQGGSLFTTGALEESGKQSIAQTNEDVKAAVAAGPVMTSLKSMTELYKKVLADNNASVTGQLSNNMQQWLADTWHIQGGDKPQAIREISMRMLPLVAQLRGIVGFQKFTQGEFNRLASAVASGEMTPQMFNDFVGSTEAGLQQAQQVGVFANNYQLHPTPSNLKKLNDVKMAISQQDPFANFRAQNPSLFPPDAAATLPAATKPPPPIGTIENGHRYIGGQPNDPKSWMVVQ